MSTLLQGLSAEVKSKIKKRKSCGFKYPMLATLAKKQFFDPKWIFEEKFDGVRCIVVKQGKRSLFNLKVAII